MAKDTRVTFDNSSPNPSSKQNGRTGRHSRTERQISYEETENCVNEMSESFPALSNRAHRLMRQVSESFNFRTIKVLLIVSAILNLLLGIPFGIFLGMWLSIKSDSSSSSSSDSFMNGNSNSHIYHQGFSMPQTSWNGRGGGGGMQQQNQLQQQTFSASSVNMGSCFKCSDIISPEVWSKVRVRSKNNICCSDEQVPEMEMLYLSQEYRTNRQRVPDSYPCRSATGRRVTCYGDLPPPEVTAAAHLNMDVAQTKRNMKDHTRDYLAWTTSDSDDARNFLGDGVLYAKGTIKVLEPGKYHVYTQVTLDTNDNQLKPSEEEKIIQHSIMAKVKGTRDEYQPLIVSQITMKKNEVRSTNTEGTFMFSKDDEIVVYISHPQFIKDSKEGNSFGLFKL